VGRQGETLSATQVTTGDVRELVGSKELLVVKVFSTVDERYKELRLRSYAPIAVALITTEEVPTTVRGLADRAGSLYLLRLIFSCSDHRLRKNTRSQRFGP